MKKMYVPKTLSDFITESKSIPLKRKYGERPAVTAGTNAPLRNQVLSFVAESGSVSKIDLKKFIIGLKEGGSTPAAANMFIKRNAKYFMTESRNGVTYFKLSNLGKRLVNQFIPNEIANVSETSKNTRSKLSTILESKLRKHNFNEKEVDDESIDGSLEYDDMEENPEFDVPEDAEASLIGGEGPAEEIEFEDPDKDEELEDSEEDLDLASKVAELESRVTELEEEIAELKGEGDEEPKEDEESSKELETDEDEEFEFEGDEEFEDRKFDFKDKGRPGLLGMDESSHVMKAQFVSHKLTGKKSPKLGGKLDPKLHNLLDDNQDKDPNELKEANNLGKKLDPKLHNLLTNDQDKDDNELKNFEDEITESDNRTKRMKEIIENLKSKRVNEAEESSEDELKDEDLDDINLDDETLTDDETATTLDGEDEGVEKVEITEFIITVDDVDSAISELTELGVTAERVESEPKEEEVPAEIEEEPIKDDEEDLELDLGDEEQNKAEVAKESLETFIKANYLNEEGEEDQKPEDLGTSDELGLGDQGEEAKELDDTGDEEEVVEPTTEFEENKIKVKAEDWDILKDWLEDKGVDVKEMFGGDIETEEISPEEAAAEETPVEISDDDINFDGIGDKDDTRVKEE